MPDLEERVAALEAALTFPYTFAPSPSMTEAEVAELREAIEEVVKLGPIAHHVIPSPPPLTRDQVRCLLRECVTVVKPGETLVIRVPATWNPMQVREYAEAVYDRVEYLDLPFKAFVVTGDELAVAEPEPDFMSEARVEEFIGTRSQGAVIRLTHLPTGVTVEAPTRPEAVAKLGRALKRRGVPGAA